MFVAAATPVTAFAAVRPLSAATGNDPVPFDRSTVVNLARELAKKDFVPPPSDLPEAIADLTYDQYRDIRFKTEAAIWADTDLPFRLQLFHRGFYFANRIDVAIVDGEEAYSLAYAPDLFAFGERVPRPLPDTDIGFSGVRF